MGEILCLTPSFNESSIPHGNLWLRAPGVGGFLGGPAFFPDQGVCMPSQISDPQLSVATAGKRLRWSRTAPSSPSQLALCGGLLIGPPDEIQRWRAFAEANRAAGLGGSFKKTVDAATQTETPTGSGDENSEAVQAEGKPETSVELGPSAGKLPDPDPPPSSRVYSKPPYFFKTLRAMR